MPSFKIGDQVRVIKKVVSQIGWTNHWFTSPSGFNDMDHYIDNGKTYTIMSIHFYGIRFKEDQTYAWPSDALVLVSEYKPTDNSKVNQRIKRLWNESNWVRKNPHLAY